MSLLECFTFLLMGIAIIATISLTLKTESEIDEINKQIGYLFDWLAEENRKIDKLDDIVQELERK